MIHLDFTIEKHDLFRVSLEMAKFRLAGGIGIAVVVVTSIIWFFSFIGEQEILLEVSPLFIGFPILGVAGQVLRLHAACRKYVKGIPESQRRAQYMFQADTDGYDVTWGGSFAHILWQDLLKVIEKRNYFIIYFNKYDARLLPKRGFHQQSDIPLFRKMVSSHLGTKAKLLTDSN